MVNLVSSQENNIDVYIGSRLKQRRTVIGLSQQAVANGTGITFQQVQKYEKGQNAMNPSRLMDFAKFLDVPVTYFFEGYQGSKFPEKELIDNSYNKALSSDRETLELVKAFRKVKSSHVRKNIADLVRSIVNSER